MRRYFFSIKNHILASTLISTQRVKLSSSFNFIGISNFFMDFKDRTILTNLSSIITFSAVSNDLAAGNCSVRVFGSGSSWLKNVLSYACIACPKGLRPVFFISLMAISGVGYAQPTYVFARNSPENTEVATTVQVKWFCSELLNEEGFNVYRREAGSSTWVLLNDSPVKRAARIPNTELQKDEELEFFMDLVNKAPEDLNDDFMFFNLLLKSFQSNVLARFLGIFFEDHSAISGTEYQYKVTRLTTGSEVQLEVSRSIQAGAYERGAPVSGVEVYQEKKYIAINWEQSERLYYAVDLFQKDGNGSVEKMNDQPLILSMVPDSTGVLRYPSPMFKKKGFEENTAYSFYLEGLDYFGERTQPSEEVAIIFDDTTPPPVPNGLEGKADSMEVHLRWNHERVGDLKGYRMLRSTKSEGPFEPVNDDLIHFLDSTYVESIAIPGPYYYCIEAIDHAENVARSQPAFVEVQDVFPPAAPTGLTIEADTGQFYLRWDSNSETDLQGYFVFRTVDSHNPDHYHLLNASPLDTNFYTQVLPKSVKNEFLYFVVAVDTSFNRSGPSHHAIGALPDVTPPESPFISRVDYNEEGIVVQWSPNVEEDLAGYHIYRMDSSSGAGYSRMNIDTLGAQVYRYVDRSADANKDYYYLLEAMDRAGNVSERSAPVFAKSYEEEAVEEELSLKIRTKRRRKTNRLEWNAISSVEVKGYVLYRGASTRTLKPLSGIIKAGTAYTDKVDSESGYYYQLRAYTLTGQVIYSPTITYNMN